MKKNIISLLLFFVCQISVFGQNALRYDFDNKVIDANSISLPKTTSLQQVLQVLPELLYRPGENLLDNYDLQIEGLTVGDSKDAIFSQILLMDIEKIEITNSASSNYTNNGQGGGINIVLKKLQPGTSGNAFAQLGLPSDYIPGLSLNRATGQWSIRSFLTGEVSNQEGIDTHYSTVKDGLTVDGSDKNTREGKDNLHQMAKLYANYSGGRNEWKLAFSEMMDKNANTILTSRSTASASTQRDNSTRKMDVLFKTEYGRQFACNGTAKLVAQYNYVPKRDKSTMTTATDVFSQTDDNKHALSGKAEYGQIVYWGDNGNRKQGSKGYFRFQAGSKYNYTHIHSDADQQMGEFIPSRQTTFNNLFLSPYLTLKSSLGNVSIMAKIEYQIYRYKLDAQQQVNGETDDPVHYNYTNKNYVGAFATVWNISKSHALRFIANRSLKRPSETQMLPFMLYSIANLRLEQGNADLKPIIMNTVELEYLFNHEKGLNKWQMSLGGSFTHTIDNINKASVYNKEVDDNVTTWNNSSKDNILNINAMLSWKHDWFAITANGNFFNRHTLCTETSYSYCNFSLMPEVQTHNDWNICLKVKHNTKVKQSTTTLPPITSLSLLVAKSWNQKFTAFASGTVSLNHKVDELTYLSSGAVDMKSYVPVTDCVYAGIRYNF